MFDRMSDCAALLAAIREAPDDDAPRLVYADWLDEHGQPERAEFIRVQCELARHDSAELRTREAELLAERHDDFAGALAFPGLQFRFRRGFIVGFGHTGMFVVTEERPGLERLHHLLRFYPDRTVQGTDSTGKPKQVARWLRRGHADSGYGKYYLEALDYPAGIRFTCSDSRGAVDYRGALESESLLLDTHSRINGHRSRQRYTLVPVQGYHSFTES